MVWPFLYPIKTQEGPRWCVDSGEGKLPKRRRWKFQSKTAAERKATELRGVWESYGRSGFMSDVDRADVLAARAKLAEFQLANTRLVEAVDFYILHKKPHGGDVTLQELFDKLIVERELSPRPPSPSYRRSLDEILGPWLKDKGNGTRMASSVTTAELKEHLTRLTLRDGTPASNKTKSNLYAYLGVLFNFGVEAQHLPASPLSFKNAWAEASHTRPGILSVAQSVALVKAARADWLRRKDWSIYAYVIFGLYCGCRREELLRLKLGAVKRYRWLEIDMAESKTRGFRKIPIPYNAVLLWQEVMPRAIDPALPLVKAQGFRKRWDAVKVAAGFNAQGPGGVPQNPWPKNAQRHSFASYFYAVTQDRAELMQRLGHTTDAVTFSYYLADVPEKLPLAYWRTVVTKEQIAEMLELEKDLVNVPRADIQKSIVKKYHLTA